MELPAVWGVHSISKELFDCIGHFVPSGSTLLEFGSGWGTSQLCEKYKVISIEDNERFLNLYPSTYIYAPKHGRWYSMEKIAEQLTVPYDAVLVDGNDQDDRLRGLFANDSFFNWNAIWFFDDLNITTINIDFEDYMKAKGRHFVKYQVGPKPFGVLLPPSWEGKLWSPVEVQT